MSFPQIVWAFAVGCAICVFLLFLFPASSGPFQAVHGPATALRAKQAADLIFLRIAFCGLLVAAMVTSDLSLFFSWTSWPFAEIPSTAPLPLLCVLRC